MNGVLLGPFAFDAERLASIVSWSFTERYLAGTVVGDPHKRFLYLVMHTTRRCATGSA